ncbi:pseudaminic acid synthase [bacterium]|nr:pseudaminic acid synthase [bacterium]
MTFNLDGRLIGPNQPPYIIAELSANHNGSLARALSTIDAAQNCGADAIKLQTYTADSMTIDCDAPDFIIQGGLWDGYKLYDLYKRAETPYEWHQAMFEHARKLGITAFSTPFDDTAVDLLEDLNTPAYKIASFENNHLPLIKKVASTGKPIIISTGMATLGEIEDIISILKNVGIKDFALLKCTSTYPSDPKNSNIRTIPILRKLFDCEVGLSDHTLGIGASIAAVSKGASIIEKHFTLKRTDGGVDSTFSLEPIEMKALVKECSIAHASLGSIQNGPLKDEQGSIYFKRSIYISKDIKKGTKLDKDNIRIVRPGFGLKPKYLDIILGAFANGDYKKGTAVKWGMFNFI